MAALSISSVTNPLALRELYADPYIARVGHDHRSAEVLIHPDAHYFAASVDGVMVGAFLLIESGYIEVDVHALLRRQALPHCRDLGRLFLDEVFRMQHVQRVMAQVIEGLESARNYCLRLGFKNEGFKRAACMRSGQLVGVHMLGLTRTDWGQI